MKSRPSRPPGTRRQPARGVAPPDVPEVTRTEGTRTPAQAVKAEADPVPEHIRRMLEAAYT